MGQPKMIIGNPLKIPDTYIPIHAGFLLANTLLESVVCKLLNIQFTCSYYSYTGKNTNANSS